MVFKLVLITHRLRSSYRTTHAKRRSYQEENKRTVVNNRLYETTDIDRMSKKCNELKIKFSCIGIYYTLFDFNQ